MHSTDVTLAVQDDGVGGATDTDKLALEDKVGVGPVAAADPVASSAAGLAGAPCGSADASDVGVVAHPTVAAGPS